MPYAMETLHFRFSRLTPRTLRIFFLLLSMLVFSIMIISISMSLYAKTPYQSVPKSWPCYGSKQRIYSYPGNADARIIPLWACIYDPQSRFLAWEPTFYGNYDLTFPNTDLNPMSITTPCGLCGGSVNNHMCLGPQGSHQIVAGALSCRKEDDPHCVEIVPYDGITYVYQRFSASNLFHAFVEGLSLFATMMDDSVLSVNEGVAELQKNVRLLSLDTGITPPFWKFLVQTLSTVHMNGSMWVRQHECVTFHGQHVYIGLRPDVQPLTLTRPSDHDVGIMKSVLPLYRDYVLRSSGLDVCGVTKGVVTGVIDDCLVVVVVRRSGERRYSSASMDSMRELADSMRHQCRFEFVVLEDLTFVEQTSLIQKTRVFIGVYGAALTHTAFLCDPKAIVVALYPKSRVEEKPDVYEYEAIATVVGVEYVHMESVSDENGVTVDVDALRGILSGKVW